MAFEIENNILKKYIPENNEKIVTVPEGVTAIDEQVFQNCSHIEKVVLPESVTYIGRWAFDNCKNLKTINLPENLGSIGWNAFRRCQKLTSVKIPENLIHINSCAFWECENLTSVKFPANVRVDSHAFWDCTHLQKAEFTYSSTKLKDSCFKGCPLKEVHLFINANQYITCEIGKEAFDPDVLLHIHLIDDKTVFKMPFGTWEDRQDEKELLYFLDAYTWWQGKETHKDNTDERFQKIKNGTYKLFLAMFMVQYQPQKELYQKYLKRNIKKAVKTLTDRNDIAGMETLLKTGYVTKKNIDEFIRYAIDNKKTEIQVILMNWKNENTPAESIEKQVQKKFKL